MALFRFLWLRRFFRKHTSPIEESRAAVWKQRLSIIYAVSAWNAFGYVLYMIYTGKGDWAKYHGIKTNEDVSPGHAWAKTLGTQGARVYRVNGFSVEKVEENDKSTNKNI